MDLPLAVYRLQTYICKAPQQAAKTLGYHSGGRTESVYTSQIAIIEAITRACLVWLVRAMVGMGLLPAGVLFGHRCHRFDYGSAAEKPLSGLHWTLILR